MATPRRKWFRGHHGTRGLIQDNDLLAFYWGLSELLCRKMWMDGRTAEDVSTGSSFSYAYLCEASGKKTRYAATSLAKKLASLTSDRNPNSRPEIADLLGVISFEFAEASWRCIWPMWAELQASHSRHVPDKRATSAPGASPEERKGDETRENETRGKETRDREWKELTGLWDAQTLGGYGSIQLYLPAARGYFMRNGKKATAKRLVEDCIRRAEHRQD